MKAYFPYYGDEKDKDLIVVNPAIIPASETVFSMTIHKSQGSEFNSVMVILPKTSDHQLLTRELLYTGITRAKEEAIIQSSLALVVRTTEKTVNRVSGIGESIKL